MSLLSLITTRLQNMHLTVCGPCVVGGDKRGGRNGGKREGGEWEGVLSVVHLEWKSESVIVRYA